MHCSRDWPGEKFHLVALVGTSTVWHAYENLPGDVAHLLAVKDHDRQSFGIATSWKALRS